MSPRPLTASARVFQALLACYPAAFRDEYGREMRLVFADRYRDAASALDRASIWLEAITGIIIEAPKEHARMMRQDLRFAWRTLRRNALLTSTIVLTLGLGIGANTAVFSVLNAVALRATLSVPEPEQLYTVNNGRHIATGQENARLSGPTFELLRSAAPEGVGVAAMSRAVARVYTRTGADRETTPASLQLVSTNFFPVLGVSPIAGATFPSVRDAAIDAPIAVISHGYWQRRFGGSPTVIGSTLTINGTAFTIVGVGPRDFVGVWLETPVDIWTPLAMQPALKYSQNFSADDGATLSRAWLPQTRIWWLHVIVRAPREHLAATLGALNAAQTTAPGTDTRIVLEPFARGFSRFRQQFSTPLVALMIMASLVLLIACANVANILLARAVGRQREIAIRVAIGAGRSRLFHQLLTESALLVIMAAISAILFARWAGDALVRVATSTVTGTPPFSAILDLRVLAFAAGVALASVLIFGIWPSWRATRVDVVGALKAGTRGAIGGATTPARLLVILQVALSLVLVMGTALFVRSFQNLIDVGLGFESARLLTVAIEPRLAGSPDANLPDTYARILEAVTRTPGVESAALGMCGLQGPCAREDEFIVEGYQPRPGENVMFSVNSVTPGYLPTLGVHLLAGRGLGESDTTGTTRVAVVNKTLARTYFAGDWQAAIGRRIGTGTPTLEIVGIVDDIRALGNVKMPAMPSVFMPLAQRPAPPREVVVRTAVDPASASADVRQAISRAAPSLPIDAIEAVATRMDRGLSQERVLVLLTSGFSLLAVGLAGFGLFGVLSYAVVRRTPELGLRMALGAPRSRVVQGVVRDALWLVGCGVLLGLPLALLGSKLVTMLTFGVLPYDGMSLLAALAVLIGIAAACAIVPAVRASRIDPVIALRSE